MSHAEFWTDANPLDPDASIFRRLELPCPFCAQRVALPLPQVEDSLCRAEADYYKGAFHHIQAYMVKACRDIKARTFKDPSLELFRDSLESLLEDMDDGEWWKKLPKGRSH